MGRIFNLPSAVAHSKEVEQWFFDHDDELGLIAQHWFKIFRACGDDVRELLHDGHVNLGFFGGAELQDPASLLEGTGKFMRHVKIKPNEAIDAPRLQELVEAAYTEMKARI